MRFDAHKLQLSACCPACGADLFLPITIQNASEAEGYTLDCWQCEAMLIVKNGELESF